MYLFPHLWCCLPSMWPWASHLMSWFCMNSQSQIFRASRITAPFVAAVCFLNQVEFFIEYYAGSQTTLGLLAQHLVTDLYTSPQWCQAFGLPMRSVMTAYTFLQKVLFCCFCMYQDSKNLRSPQSRASSYCLLSSYQLPEMIPGFQKVARLAALSSCHAHPSASYGLCSSFASL
jgi:hypothetical protein